MRSSRPCCPCLEVCRLCLCAQSAALLCLCGNDNVCDFLQDMEQHFCNRLAVSCGPGDIRGSQVSHDKTTNCKQPIDSSFAGVATRCSASSGIWSCLQACALACTFVCMQYIGLFAHSTLAWVYVCVYKSKCFNHVHTAFVRLAWTLLASICFCLTLCLSSKCLLELVDFMSCQSQLRECLCHAVHI